MVFISTIFTFILHSTIRLTNTPSKFFPKYSSAFEIELWPNYSHGHNFCDFVIKTQVL